MLGGVNAMRNAGQLAVVAFFLITVALAQQSTPGEKQIAGVTAQMLPDPPQSAITPPQNVSGPTFDQTLQWMAETAPRNAFGGDWDYPVTTYVLPGSTCSKLGFAIFGGKSGRGADWLAVNLGTVDPRGVFAFGDKVLFGGAVVQVTGANAEKIIKGKRSDSTGVIDELTFGTPEYASRFASALRHAAEVCGGTAPPPPAGQLF